MIDVRKYCILEANRRIYSERPLTQSCLSAEYFQEACRILDGFCEEIRIEVHSHQRLSKGCRWYSDKNGECDLAARKMSSLVGREVENHDSDIYRNDVA